MIRVLLISPWQTKCGIASYGEFLLEAVHGADRDIWITVAAEPLTRDLDDADLVVLNHAQNSSGLRDLLIASHAKQRHLPLVIIQHDTFETVAIMQERGFPDFRGVDALIIHEPVEGLMDLPNVHWWRHGAPGPEPPERPLELRHHPLLGSAGFPLPWKNYDLLAEATGQAGWGLLLIASGATAEQIARWGALNPLLHVETGFPPSRRVISLLTGCDATAFLYTTGGSAVSGALRLGMAARKPIFLTPGSVCRQFRELGEDPGLRVIDPSVHALWTALEQLQAAGLGQEDPEVVRLAERDSWDVVGRLHANLWHRLVEAPHAD